MKLSNKKHRKGRKSTNLAKRQKNLKKIVKKSKNMECHSRIEQEIDSNLVTFQNLCFLAGFPFPEFKQDCADYLCISLRNLNRYIKGEVNPHPSCVKLLKLRALNHLPHDRWQGWTLNPQTGEIHSPDGLERFTPEILSRYSQFVAHKSYAQGQVSVLKREMALRESMKAKETLNRLKEIGRELEDLASVSYRPLKYA